ncbi:unnamed protein product [Adineta steineri]|uniref:Uncharacterized protein n=1 Tax=Adineta steineri TaxID=433720 RepID=A0A813R793_9BILA|nr:unnamed protein product [Adineta steineri]CAF1212062.1 unnamed protein product [Adineta steineri]
MGEFDKKTLAYLSHSPILYQRPFTPTTTAAVLINETAHNINNYLWKYPAFIGETSVNLTNINMIIGGGGVVKPDYFRNGFDLINNNDHNNIHNHLTADGAQQIYYQLKHHLTILLPLTFIISDEAENEGNKDSVHYFFNPIRRDFLIQQF